MIDVKAGKVYKTGGCHTIICLYAEKNFSILLEISRDGKVDLIRYWRSNFVDLTLL